MIKTFKFLIILLLLNLILIPILSSTTVTTRYRTTIKISESKVIEYGYYYEIRSSEPVRSGSIISGRIVSDKPIQVVIYLNNYKIYESGFKSLIDINLKTQYDGYLYVRIYNNKADLEDSGAITVSAGSSERKSYLLDSDVDVQITVYISGGWGDDADIYIYDPDGFAIIGGRYSRSFSYRFKTSKPGYYTIMFGNTFSIISSKTITYSILATSSRTVNIDLEVQEPYVETLPKPPSPPSIPPLSIAGGEQNNSLTIILILLVIGLSIAVIVLIILYLRRPKTTSSV